MYRYNAGKVCLAQWGPFALQAKDFSEKTTADLLQANGFDLTMQYSKEHAFLYWPKTEALQ